MKPAIIRPELKLKREIKELPVRNVIYIRLFGDRYGFVILHYVRNEKPYLMKQTNTPTSPAYSPQ